MENKLNIKIKIASGVHELTLPLCQNEFDKVLCDMGIPLAKREEHEILSVSSGYKNIDKALLTGDIEEVNYFAHTLQEYEDKFLSAFENYLAYKEENGTQPNMKTLMDFEYTFLQYENSELVKMFMENKNHYKDVDAAMVDYYDGKFLPMYAGSIGDIFNVHLCNPELADAKNKTVTLELPASDTTIQRALNRLGIEPEKVVIKEVDSEGYENICESITPDSNIYEVNKLANLIDNIPSVSEKTFYYAVENITTGEIRDLIKFASFFVPEALPETPDILIGRPETKALLELNDKINNIVSDIKSEIENTLLTDDYAEIDLNQINMKHDINLEFNDVLLNTVLEILGEEYYFDEELDSGIMKLNGIERMEEIQDNQQKPPEIKM